MGKSFVLLLFHSFGGRCFFRGLRTKRRQSVDCGNAIKNCVAAKDVGTAVLRALEESLGF